MKIKFYQPKSYKINVLTLHHKYLEVINYIDFFYIVYYIVLIELHINKYKQKWLMSLTYNKRYTYNNLTYNNQH